MEVEAVTETPPCARCGGPSLLSVRVPRDITRADGGVVRGTAIVVLCPACDVDHPQAGALITFFAVHGEATVELLDQAADLLAAWEHAIEVPAVDVEALEAEVEEWYRGEL